MSTYLHFKTTPRLETCRICIVQTNRINDVRPLLPPSKLPRSIASSNSSAERWLFGPIPHCTLSPGTRSDAKAWFASSTTRPRSVAFASSRSSDASSSPTILSPGNARERMVFTTAWAEKSPTGCTKYICKSLKHILTQYSESQPRIRLVKYESI